MQSLTDLQEKIFFECKNILENLSKISTQEDLLVKQDLINELSERVILLKYFEKNYEIFESSQQESEKPESESVVEEPAEITDTIEEEVLFNNELNEIHTEDSEVLSESLPINTLEEADTNSSSDIPEVEAEENFNETEELHLALTTENQISEELNDEEAVEKNIEQQPIYESKREIKEIHKEDFKPNDELFAPESFTEAQPDENPHHEKKFKLAHIKGLKSIKSIFDDDPFEEEEEKDLNKPMESSSLLKTNVPTDYMEAEKPKPEFRLDLNDKIAFSKALFGGSQSDLNNAIRTLNSFKNIEDAKEYLSDLYYEKNWKKVDDIAQRLWTLVENKFM